MVAYAYNSSTQGGGRRVELKFILKCIASWTPICALQDLSINLGYTRPFSKIKNKTKAINNTKQEESNEIVFIDHISKILNTEHEII